MTPRYEHDRHGIHNLSRPEVIADPTRYVDAIAELGPLFYDEVGKAWVCTGYAEAAEILSDHHRFSSARTHSAGTLNRRGLTEFAGVGGMLLEQMLFMDPPDQVEIRAAVRDQFAPARVRERDATMRALAAAAVADLPARGTLDLVGDFAEKLHVELVGALLGMTGRPAELTRWANAYGRLIGSLSTLPNLRDREVIPILDEAMAAFREVARQRLDDPGDDIVSSLVQGLHGRARSSDRETEFGLDTVAANCVVFAAGGYQTLTHLISIGLVLLHDNPAQRDLLRERPELIDPAIDEFMRVNGSSQYLARQANQDLDFHGVSIRAGQPIIVLLGAVNLDPRRFADPKTLDITRQQGRHLGFGLGRHYCIGAPYAERVARWAILAFLDRYPGYRLRPGDSALEWGPHVNTRCLRHAYTEVGLISEKPAPEQPVLAAPVLAESLMAAPLMAAPPMAEPLMAEPVRAGSHARWHQQLVDWNDNVAPLGPVGCWHQVFEQRALVAPDAVAAEDQGVGYSYREIDERANGTARLLRDRGVQPETVVGVVLDRSVQLLIAMLAVAKAGGAFLLSDQTCPPERLRVMLADAGVRLVLTNSDLVDQLTGLRLAAEVRVVGPERAATPPVTGVVAGNTAYVVFTSGTTGRPKAIAISHEAVVNLHVAQRRVFGIRPADRVLQFFSPNFDGCVFDVVMAVLCGATLVLVPAAGLMVGPPLLRTLRAGRVSVASLTPSVWAALALDPLPDLRIASSAGERLPASVVRRWAAPGRRFLNLYGPAETAVWTTWHECGTEDEPPIGRPVANKRVYVLDEELRPVPVGTAGELCVGGTGVGRYLGRPELMETRYRPDPFATSPGQLLYRTGDICRWRVDGALEYLGRRDRQTKIRGQRVELDEVERVVQSCPGVLQCSVTERDGHLEAMIVADNVAEPGLREHLTARLHSGMVPAKFEFVDELPRTLSGKTSREPIDIPAPAPVAVPPIVPARSVDRIRTDPDAHLFARVSLLTWRIAQFFATSLELPQHQVKAESNFFLLGGDSLANAELLASVEGEVGVLLDVAELLREPTPAGIATYLAHQQPERS